MYSSRSRRPLALVFFTLLLGGCPESANESTRTNGSDATQIKAAATPEPATTSAPVAASGTITRENVLENERYWPDIVAMVEAWTDPESGRLIKKGYRGALIRVDERGRTRIAFGRHGTRDIPIEQTDLISRANEVASGTRHKVAPNFLAHFGTQFVHPSSDELIPYPMLELARSDRFLCVFADPRSKDFAELARGISPLASTPGVQLLVFPLAMKRDETQLVKDLLKNASLQAPFAYPEAAEVHARTLLGEVPSGAVALLVTSEGRVLHNAGMTDTGTVEALRTALDSPVPLPAQ